MEIERKHRTPDEVTGDLLVKRLDNNQLLQLVGNEEFIKYQSKILDVLQKVNGFRSKDFKKVHSSNECILNEFETGEDIRVKQTDIDFGTLIDMVPLKKLMCSQHNVQSDEFFILWRRIYEGPFRCR